MRPSYAQAQRELAEAIDPVKEALFASIDPKPEPNTSSQNCADPFIGPRKGLRPTIAYTIPLSSYSGDAESFIRTAEEVWREAGLEIQSDETDALLYRSATQGDYSVNASVNLANMEAYLSGTGPCVDDPET